MQKIPLLVVAGPTASGKTKLSIALAQSLGAEIVNADSMQVYKKLNIGTAKPTKEEQAQAVHHLIDILEPAESFSVAKYCELAHQAIYDIHSRGKRAILTGGTGLYIDSVACDIAYGEVTGDENLRKNLFEIVGKQGNEALHRLLAEKDPAAAKRLHPNDVKRVARALEVFLVSGKSILEHEKKSREKESRYNVTYVGLTTGRERLYERINARVDAMLEEGLLKEAQDVLALCGEKSTAMQSLGYKEFIPYFAGAVSLNEAVETLKQNTRRYAKRQLSWFRRNPEITWYDSEDSQAAEKIVQTLNARESRGL